ncbi:protein disulfide isomerase [Scheffersomyces coipomensis]|uniref:protein disulfide isomerase n=1 Tax=Scheffersomyces coipomensis TaxID=1788519 RepID=UPI00315C83E3
MVSLPNLKVYHILLFSFTLFSAVVHAYSGSSNLIQIDDNSFKKVAIESGKYVLVDFYADWCRHCANLMPTIEELADLFEPYQDQITITKINGDKDGKKMARKYADIGFPTLKLFHGDDKPIEFDGMRDLQSISNFIQVASGVRLGEDNTNQIEDKQQILEYMNNEEENEKEDHIIKLDDATFDNVILDSGVKHSIVVFSATWCKYCQELKPFISELSNDIFINDKNQLQFAVVEKDVVEAEKIFRKYNVEYLPAILYFNSDLKDDPIVIKNRDLPSLLEKINDLTKIHRIRSGRLSDRAGRIEKLDRIIQSKSTLSKNIAIEILNKEVSKFEDSEMINYYKKLLNKIINDGTEESQKFFNNEINRLSNILTNDIAKLKSTIIDSMERRLNILKVFI